MKKTLIALAVAGVVAAPAAMAEVTVYGLAHVSLDNVSSDANGDTSLAVTSRASRVGVKASEDLGGGLKAIAQMEWQVDMADANGGKDTDLDGDGKPDVVANNNITSRNQIVGLSGGFGTIAIGRHDTPYKMSTGSLDVFADTAADYNYVIGTPAGLENRADNAVAYLSPDMSGFSVQAAVVAADVDKACTAADATCDDANAADATSVALQYKNGPLFVAVATEMFEDEVATGGGKGQSGVRAGVGYDMGVAKVGFTYETASDVGASDDDYTAMLVNAAVPVGASNTIIAEYGTGTFDKANLDRSIAAVGFAHSFSKASSGYVAYGTTSEDVAGGGTNDTNVLTAGMVVKF